MSNQSSQNISQSTDNGARQNKSACPSRLNSKSLFGAENEIVIEHNGVAYRLRITSNGKLILTK